MESELIKCAKSPAIDLLMEFRRKANKKNASLGSIYYIHCSIQYNTHTHCSVQYNTILHIFYYSQ